MNRRVDVFGTMFLLWPAGGSRALRDVRNTWLLSKNEKKKSFAGATQWVKQS